MKFGKSGRKARQQATLQPASPLRKTLGRFAGLRARLKPMNPAITPTPTQPAGAPPSPIQTLPQPAGAPPSPVEKLPQPSGIELNPTEKLPQMVGPAQQEAQMKAQLMPPTGQLPQGSAAPVQDNSAIDAQVADLQKRIAELQASKK